MMKFLGKFDVFAYKPQLRFRNQEKFPSNAGLLATLVIIVLGILLLVVFSKNMAENLNPIILTKNKFFASPPKVLVDFSLLSIGVGIRNFENSSLLPSDSIKQKFFEIDFALVEIYQASSGKATTKKAELDKVPCSSSRFSNNIDIVPEDENISERNLTCIKPSKVFLEGRYGSPEYTYLELSVRLCNASTDENCAANENIRGNGGTFLLEVFLSDSMLDLSDYNNPVKNTLKTIYTISSFNISKLTRITLQTGEVLTSDDWFSSSFNAKPVPYISFGEPQETGFVDRTLANSRRGGAAIFYEFSIANVKQIHERRYEKIYDVLAKIGGLIKILLILGQSFVNPFSRSAYHRELAEALGVSPDKNQMKRVSLSSPTNKKSKQVQVSFADKKILELKLYFKRQNHYKKVSKLIEGKMDLFYILKQLINNSDNKTNTNFEKIAYSTRINRTNEDEHISSDKRDQKKLINVEKENHSSIFCKKEFLPFQGVSQNFPEQQNLFIKKENSIKPKEKQETDKEMEPEWIMKTEEGIEGPRKDVINC